MTIDTVSEMTEVKDRIKKLETDMYFGEGKENPPVTMRLSRLEDTIGVIKKLEWLLVATIVATVPNLLAMLFKVLFK